MKALFVSNDPSIFDETSSARARMRSYADAIGTLHILSRAPAGSRKVEDGALTLHPLAGTRLQAFLRRADRARAIIEEEGIDIVSAQDPFEHGYAAMKAVEGTSAKLHIQIHTDFLSPWFVRSGGFRSPQVRAPFLNRLRRHLADRVLPKAAGIRAVSERVRASVVARYGNRVPEPSVIPIAVEARVPDASPLPPHESTFTLITVSRLEPEKRIEDILYSLARVGYQYETVGLIVVGEGSERSKLERLARRLGLANRVVFAGADYAHGWGMMRNAQAYIQASAYEGYGRTLIEAALARVPIITTDVGIVGDVFMGYEDVLSAPVGDPAALATHIRGLVDDHQAREIFVLAAETKARDHLASVGNLPSRIAHDLALTLSGG